MVNKNRSFILNFIAIMICSTFSACTSSGSEISNNTIPTNMAIIYGKHQNSKKIQPDLTDDIKDIYVASRDSKLMLIEVDSNPSVVHVDITDIINDKNYERWRKNNITQWEQYYFDTKDKNGIKNIVDDAIESLQIDSSEVDTFAAIDEASKFFSNNNDETAKKKIIICDTGFSTSGEVSFCDSEWLNLLLPSTDDGAIENKIESLHIGEYYLNDLKNTEIEWYGIGEVSGKQDPLGAEKKSILKKIWQKILERAGATVKFKEVNNTNENWSSDFPVSTVCFQIPDNGLYVEIGFKPAKEGTDQHKELNCSHQEAVDALRPIAEYLKLTNEKVYLVGTAADDDYRNEKNAIKISEDRASVIKELLITEFSLNGENLIVYGKGSKEDTDYTESNMAANRMVKIILKNSPKGQDMQSVLN
ncbi:MAG: OmpA family protein [Alistipes sp.]|nr:OmpA family protein [Alistipes sp.]